MKFLTLTTARAASVEAARNSAAGFDPGAPSVASLSCMASAWGRR